MQIAECDGQRHHYVLSEGAKHDGLPEVLSEGVKYVFLFIDLPLDHSPAP